MPPNRKSSPRACSRKAFTSSVSSTQSCRTAPHASAPRSRPRTRGKIWSSPSTRSPKRTKSSGRDFSLKRPSNPAHTYALHGGRAFQRRRRAGNLRTLPGERPHDAGRARVHLELDRCRSKDLLSIDADRRRVVVPALDRNLERFGGIRNRAAAHFDGHGANCYIAIVIEDVR